MASKLEDYSSPSCPESCSGCKHERNCVVAQEESTPEPIVPFGYVHHYVDNEYRESQTWVATDSEFPPPHPTDPKFWMWVRSEPFQLMNSQKGK